MKQIRRNVFETNSSSTHSMTIKRVEDSRIEIPHNLLDLDICKEMELPFNTCVIGEFAKLRYVIGLIGRRIVELSEDLGIDNCYAYDYEKEQEGFDKFKDKILSFDWIVWIKELIQEECNTTLAFNLNSKEFPFITECPYFDDTGVLDTLDIDDKDARDEGYMKAFFKDLIFNSSVVIQDLEEEY